MRSGTGKYIVMIVVVIIGAAIVAGTGAILNVLSDYQQPQQAAANGTTTGPSGTTKHVYLTLQTFPQSPDSLPAWETEHHYSLVRNRDIPVFEPHLDWVTYGPTANLTVPAYSEVTITIQNYDSGLALLNDFYSHVRGTIGNTMTVNGKPMSSVPDDDVSHTFTIHGIPSDKQPWIFVNVPVVKNSDDAVSAGADNGLVPNPEIIQFSFFVGGPGHYVWQCEYPCGTYYDGFGGPMSTNGYMNGTFDVV